MCIEKKRPLVGRLKLICNFCIVFSFTNLLASIEVDFNNFNNPFKLPEGGQNIKILSRPAEHDVGIGDPDPVSKGILERLEDHLKGTFKLKHLVFRAFPCVQNHRLSPEFLRAQRFKGYRGTLKYFEPGNSIQKTVHNVFILAKIDLSLIPEDIFIDVDSLQEFRQKQQAYRYGIFFIQCRRPSKDTGLPFEATNGEGGHIFEVYEKQKRQVFYNQDRSVIHVRDYTNGGLQNMKGRNLLDPSNWVYYEVAYKIGDQDAPRIRFLDETKSDLKFEYELCGLSEPNAHANNKCVLIQLERSKELIFQFVFCQTTGLHYVISPFLDGATLHEMSLAWNNNQNAVLNFDSKLKSLFPRDLVASNPIFDQQQQVLPDPIPPPPPSCGQWARLMVRFSLAMYREYIHKLIFLGGPRNGIRRGDPPYEHEITQFNSRARFDPYTIRSWPDQELKDEKMTFTGWHQIPPANEGGPSRMVKVRSVIMRRSIAGENGTRDIWPTRPQDWPNIITAYALEVR
jgi:hypothetical protein